jgi:regulator of protease activity HflC (stomatin/prohibitin superfamily)
MNVWTKARFWMLVGVAVVGLLIVQQIWMWEVERIEVAPGHFVVRIHRWGQDLPEDQIVAADDSYKGVMLEPLAEGRHFLNPILWGHEIYPGVEVKPGQCLVVTRRFGEPLPPGEILAHEDPSDPHKGTRGIVREVKLQGFYRLNPHAYQWELVPAVEIRADQVGVRVLKVGREPPPPDKDRGPYVVPRGCRGVQAEFAPPGTYYLNPYVESIVPVEVRSHLVELSDIAFPSRDGFILQPHITVEYAVQPATAPELLVRITDQGELFQKDSTAQEQESNAVLQKIIFPHVRGYARIEGSKFDAKDFIATPGMEGKENNREKLQKAMLAQIQPKCAALGVNVASVILSDDMKLPSELKEQISQRDQARVELEKNKARVGTYKAEQELKAKEALSQQKTEKTRAGTRLVQATTKAEQLKEVETSRLKQELENAQLRVDAAALQKTAILQKAKAEAEVIQSQNQAEIAGLEKAIQGFRGAQQFAQYHLMARLGPSLGEIFASDDSEFAKLFSSLQTPPPNAIISPKVGTGGP